MAKKNLCWAICTRQSTRLPYKHTPAHSHLPTHVCAGILYNASTSLCFFLIAFMTLNFSFNCLNDGAFAMRFKPYFISTTTHLVYVAVEQQAVLCLLSRNTIFFFSCYVPLFNIFAGYFTISTFCKRPRPKQ